MVEKPLDYRDAGVDYAKIDPLKIAVDVLSQYLVKYSLLAPLPPSTPVATQPAK